MSESQAASQTIERTQLGVRMEKRMVKVLKGTAEYLDISLGELLEDIVLHAFEGPGACAFTSATLAKVAELKHVYGMDYDVHANYRWPAPPNPNAGSSAV